MILSIGIYSPELRARPITHDVVGSSHVHHGVSVGRYLWVGHPLQVKDVHAVERGQ